MMSPQGGVEHEDTLDRFFGCPRQDLAGGRAVAAIATASRTGEHDAFKITRQKCGQRQAQQGTRQGLTHDQRQELVGCKDEAGTHQADYKQALQRHTSSPQPKRDAVSHERSGVGQAKQIGRHQHRVTPRIGLAPHHRQR